MHMQHTQTPRACSHLQCCACKSQLCTCAAMAPTRNGCAGNGRGSHHLILPRTQDTHSKHTPWLLHNQGSAPAKQCGHKASPLRAVPCACSANLGPTCAPASIQLGRHHHQQQLHHLVVHQCAGHQVCALQQHDQAADQDVQAAGAHQFSLRPRQPCYKQGQRQAGSVALIGNVALFFKAGQSIEAAGAHHFSLQAGTVSQTCGSDRHSCCGVPVLALAVGCSVGCAGLVPGRQPLMRPQLLFDTVGKTVSRLWQDRSQV